MGENFPPDGVAWFPAESYGGYGDPWYAIVSSDHPAAKTADVSCPRALVSGTPHYFLPDRVTIGFYSAKDMSIFIDMGLWEVITDLAVADSCIIRVPLGMGMFEFINQLCTKMNYPKMNFVDPVAVNGTFSP